jgi:hypothetical protein
MKPEETKATIKSITELSQSGKELINEIKITTQQVSSSKKLWREGNKSRLIKLGMAIFVFPEPTPVCEIIGAGVMAAGLVQKGIKSRAIYLEDIPKTIQGTYKELNALRCNLRI